MKTLCLWTISVIDRVVNKDLPSSSDMYMIECETIEEVKETLKDLKDRNQDMEYVTVFPPNSGFLGTNFNI